MNGCSAVHLSIFGMNPVVRHGSETMQRTYLPRVASGELHVAFAHYRGRGIGRFELSSVDVARPGQISYVAGALAAKLQCSRTTDRRGERAVEGREHFHGRGAFHRHGERLAGQEAFGAELAALGYAQLFDSR